MTMMRFSATLFAVFLSCSISLAYDATNLSMETILISVENNDMANFAYKHALKNISQLESLLNNPNAPPLARANALRFLRAACHEKVVAQDYFFRIVLHQLDNLPKLVHPTAFEEELEQLSSHISYFSYYPPLRYGYSVLDNFSYLLILLDQVKNLRSDPGIEEMIELSKTAKTHYMAKRIDDCINTVQLICSKRSSLTVKRPNDRVSDIVFRYIQSLQSQLRDWGLQPTPSWPNNTD